jgi:hypothetical protein
MKLSNIFFRLIASIPRCKVNSNMCVRRWINTEVNSEKNMENMEETQVE